MQGRTKFWLASLLVLALFLSACNFGQEPEPTPDVGAIFTAAAETVQAQFGLELTQTALAAPPPTATIPPLPPTATPLATFAIDGSNAAPTVTPLPVFGAGTQQSVILPTATSLAVLSAATEKPCLNSAFVSDVNYADGTVVQDDIRIAKSWTIQNTGTCTWDDGFSLRPVTGDAKGTWDITYKKEFVEPDEIVQVTIELKTPTKGGDWGGCWRMYSDSDIPFGTFVCLLVKIE
jgi:hypothetical protein